ncbi:MAG: hypothetical protein HUU50_03390 [Candidatus Brocadiae bacterium]|nr:hypothetical protein [Candidatus Brocadiia bacterium]
MILFHGTLEENLKSIKKNGLLAATKDQWLLEAIQKPVCCTAKNPVSGEGGNPSYFTYGNTKSKNQDGYLVVIDIPKEDLENKIIAIFDNKTLDDYVRLHFFIRHEFRLVGKEIFLRMTQHKEKDYYWKKLSEKVSKRPAKEQDTLIFSPQEQHQYYKKLKEERYVYNFLGIEISDEMYDFIQSLGQWDAVYEFLELHYKKEIDKREEWEKNAPYDNAAYWKKFYQSFPIIVSEPKKQSFQNWFSPQWLLSKKLEDFNENCQILSSSLSPEYIVGFIKISTPSGFVQPFRACRSKSGFSKEVWKQVHELICQMKS